MLAPSIGQDPSEKVQVLWRRLVIWAMVDYILRKGRRSRASGVFNMINFNSDGLMCLIQFSYLCTSAPLMTMTFDYGSIKNSISQLDICTFANVRVAPSFEFRKYAPSNVLCCAAQWLEVLGWLGW